MKADIKEKWIVALRSGKYKQGFWKLKNAENEYCCLGVLCDISPEYGVFLSGTFVDRVYGKYYLSFLPWNMQDDFELDDSMMTLLGQLNDTTIFTFEDIATILEHEEWWKELLSLYSHTSVNSNHMQMISTIQEKIAMVTK